MSLGVQRMPSPRPRLATERSVEWALDLGCGSGEGTLALAERLNGARVVGLDASLSNVREALARARHVALDVRFAVGDVHGLPFPDETFDLVRAPGVLERSDDPRAAFHELARVTRARGVVCLEEWLGGAVDEARLSSLLRGVRLEPSAATVRDGWLSLQGTKR